jgi:hypothetical protein
MEGPRRIIDSNFAEGDYSRCQSAMAIFKENSTFPCVLEELQKIEFLGLLSESQRIDSRSFKSTKMLDVWKAMMPESSGSNCSLSCFTLDYLRNLIRSDGLTINFQRVQSVSDCITKYKTGNARLMVIRAGSHILGAFEM